MKTPEPDPLPHFLSVDIAAKDTEALVIALKSLTEDIARGTHGPVGGARAHGILSMYYKYSVALPEKPE